MIDIQLTIYMSRSTILNSTLHDKIVVTEHILDLSVFEIILKRKLLRFKQAALGMQRSTSVEISGEFHQEVDVSDLIRNCIYHAKRIVFFHQLHGYSYN